MDLPESWDDEPWPLDEPALPGLSPTNWSDSHDNVPQVSDLDDEAWEYALDHGISMERALVALQDKGMGRSWTSGPISVNKINSILDDIWNSIGADLKADHDALVSRMIGYGTLVSDKNAHAKITDITNC